MNTTRIVISIDGAYLDATTYIASWNELLA